MGIKLIDWLIKIYQLKTFQLSGCQSKQQKSLNSNLCYWQIVIRWFSYFLHERGRIKRKGQVQDRTQGEWRSQRVNCQLEAFHSTPARVHFTFHSTSRDLALQSVPIREAVFKKIPEICWTFFLLFLTFAFQLTPPHTPHAFLNNFSFFLMLCCG